MRLEITELSPCDDAELIGFLNDLGQVSPSVLGYNYPFFRNMLVAGGIEQPLYLGARLNGKLVGYLPAFTHRFPQGVLYCSLPYFGPNAGVLCNLDDRRTEIHMALIQALVSRAERDRALSCAIYTPFLFDEFELYDTAMPEAVVVERFTQYLDLNTMIWDRKLAQNINKARRFGVEVSQRITPERLDTFYAIYQQNCLDVGMPQKLKKCIEFLADEAGRNARVNFYFALHEGQLVGGIASLWAPLTASWHLTCTVSSARELQATALLLDQAIQDACTHGLRFWNFESSPARDSGVYRFKQKFGAIEGAYRIYVQTFRPLEQLKALGPAAILQHFPYYYVYPFDLL